MATLPYLWSHRARFKFGSREFARAWAKRLHSLPELLRRNRRRRSLVRRGALVEATAEIGETIIEGRGANLQVGAFSFLGRAHIALHGRLEIGERVCINDGVRILTASHDTNDPQWRHQAADVHIDDFVWIATGAIILPGVTLGRGCVVGAGAVVAKSVPAGAIVVGNPARILARKRCEELNYNPCEFLAANQAWLKG